MQHLDAIMSDIHKANSTEVLWQILTGYFCGIGVTMGSYHPTNFDGSPMQIKSIGFPETWACKYLKENLIQIDPIPELASRMAEPFYWHDAASLAPSSADSQRYLEKLKQADIGDGVALYVFGPGMQNAYVGLGFGKDRLDLSPEALWALQCVAQAAHLRFCVQNAKQNKPVELTEREREILHWIARGKSNTVIAEILSISRHTIDAHIRRIYSKLNVNDRTSAAIRGVGSGLIKIES